MARIINITNGVGTSELINDTYAVTANVTGYDNSSINPSSVDIVEGTNEYSFTISSSGTLTLHVTEDGTSSGTPIVGATFVRTDSLGNIYGSPIVSDTNGDAVMANVPYAETSAPTVYYKQTASDGNHDFSDAVQSTSLTTETATIEIQNTVGATRTIHLTDANYTNLPIETGSLTLTN